MKRYLLKFSILLLTFFAGKAAFAQSCSPGTTNMDFFNGCGVGGAPYSSPGDFTITINNSGILEINGDVTINGTLFINYVGNTGFIHVQSGYKLKATNVSITNNNPVKTKVIDVDGTFEVTENLNFNDDLFDMDGTGTVTAGTITGATNVSCSSEGDCPNVSADDCDPAGSDFCQDDVDNTPMPITLKFFSVSKSNNSVFIKWVTSMEESLDAFLVQHSNDGVNFSTIETVPGAGADFVDFERAYEVQDRSPSIGLNYYRLASIDLDGTKEYFKISSIKVEGGNRISIAPNPGKGLSTIKLRSNFAPNEGDLVTIINEVGREVFKAHVVTLEDEFSLPALEPGVYMLMYRSNEHQYFERLVIID